MVQWISHRGESLEAPENTISAFKLAVKRDTEGFETDISLSADGVLVCCHDAATTRTCGVEKIISETDFVELQKLDASNGFSAYKGEKLPSYAEALAELPPGKVLYTEIKENNLAIVDAMVKEINNAGINYEQIVVISFYAEVIRFCKEHYPKFKALYLDSLLAKQDGTYMKDPEAMISKLHEIHADGLDAFARKEVLTTEFVDALRKQGFFIALWTIDDPEMAEYFINTIQPDAITSNRAGELKQWFNREER